MSSAIEPKATKQFAKYNSFLEGKPLKCRIHGVHRNWHMSEKSTYRLRRTKCNNLNRKQNIEKDNIKSLIIGARHRAKKRKMSFELTEDFLRKLLKKQKNKCTLTGISFDSDNRPSLDRINSSIGYLKENVQFVLFEINSVKMDMPEDRFIELCKLVVRENTKKLGRGRRIKCQVA